MKGQAFKCDKCGTVEFTEDKQPFGWRMIGQYAVDHGLRKPSDFVAHEHLCEICHGDLGKWLGE